MRQFVFVSALSALIGSAVPAPPARAAAPDAATEPAGAETPDQMLIEAQRQSIGAPARADIGDEAAVRLSGALVMVPPEYAAKLLTVLKRPVAAELQGLLLGAAGMQAPGLIRFIPAGFINANEALAWTPEDILFSLRASVEHRNAEREAQNLPLLEVRRWVQAPRYDPESHQLSWAALILPKDAPRRSGGDITWHAIGFGRDGYVHLTTVASLEKAETVRRDTEAFLIGLSFRPGKTYGDVVPADPRAPGGLAAAMEIDSLSKDRSEGIDLDIDTVLPIVGGIVGLIGAAGLLIYRRQQQRKRRRVRPR